MINRCLFNDWMCVDYTFSIEAAIQTKKFSDSAERENIFSNIFIFSSILRTAECAKLLLTRTVSHTFLRTIIIYLTLINNLQTITFLTIIYGPFSYFMRTIINIFIQYFRWNFFVQCVFYFILAFYRTCFCFN